MPSNTKLVLPPDVEKATLAEDFIATVRELKGPFIRVRVEGLISPNEPKECRVAFVPSLYFILPLKKGDEVYVASFSNSPTLYLWGLVDPFPQVLLDAIQFPVAGTLVSPPDLSKENTFSFHYVSPGFYFIGGDEIMVMVSGDVYTCYTPKSVITFCASDGEYSIKTKDFVVEASGAITLKSSGVSASSNNVDMKAMIEELSGIVSDIVDALSTGTTVPIAGNGAPGVGLYSAQMAAVVTKMSLWKSTKLNEFFRV